ncbi:alpha/beta hydrolase-fold protein [Hymenobacter latericus]|uniref:alpha/beta hydrolase-fold protein n=1 Tax=Hymenobacter sp. YIM 151858-1 TaxID=2987688 RepID=UPI0022276AF6|nr:alpha/beta hydrolase-fold protein [Hymenobacter sp. YIM 151858-1]UYZ60669.1 alpha/beta hydrolase-fold protein [Hymenobacter sp. YIM 151858-1]
MRLLLAVGLVLSLGQARAQTTLQLTSVPANTPAGAKLYVAGSFNNWNPASPDWQLQQAASGRYQVTLPATLTGAVEFKFTRGSWAAVETDAQFADVPNRKLTLTAAPTTVDLQVLGWKDLGTNAPAPCQSTAVQPQVRVVSTEFDMPQLGRKRRVWVYLPTGYAANPQQRYPVLYMHDGQNVFDKCTSFSGEWGVDEALGALEQQGIKAGSCIVVAVDNGGTTRLDEYSPWRNAQYGGGQGALYTDFLVQTLKPYIDANYRTLTDRANTGIAGSSMGGLISLYAATRYPNTFGRVGVFSPAFWFAEAELKAYLNQHRAAAPTRFYFVAGAQESQTMVPLMQAVRDSLQRAGYAATDLSYQVRADGQHAEWFWQREFPAAQQWLFAPALVNSQQSGAKTAMFSLYPNPAGQQLTVQLPEGWQEARLELSDTTGRVLLRRSLRGPNTPLDLSHLLKGSYTVRLKNKKQVVSRTFVKN